MKINLKRYVGFVVFLGLIIVIDGLNLSLWYVFGGMMAFGLYTHRTWLKTYCQDWMRQYHTIRGDYEKKGKRKD